jgi:hypothetical protein
LIWRINGIIGKQSHRSRRRADWQGQETFTVSYMLYFKQISKIIVNRLPGSTAAIKLIKPVFRATLES